MLLFCWFSLLLVVARCLVIGFIGVVLVFLFCYCDLVRCVWFSFDVCWCLFCYVTSSLICFLVCDAVLFALGFVFCMFVSH